MRYFSDIRIVQAHSPYIGDDWVTIAETEVFKAIRQQEEENEPLSKQLESMEGLPTVLVVEDNLDLRSYMLYN